MTNTQNIRFLLFGDIYDKTYSDSLLTDLINTHGYNGAIIMCATAELRKLEGQPTSVSESGGLSVSFDRVEGLRDILQYARTTGYTYKGNTDSNIVYGTSKVWEGREFNNH